MVVYARGNLDQISGTLAEIGCVKFEASWDLDNYLLYF